MIDDDQIERLCEIAGRFYTLPVPTTILGLGAPFDVSKPNFHDTKAEFRDEVAYVENALRHINQLIDLMTARFDKESPTHMASQNVAGLVDEKARKTKFNSPVEYPVELVVQGALSVGLSYTTLILLFENRRTLSERKQELTNQENDYWSGSGRAPNHYARTIALRFAKVIAKETGKKPTFGTSRDGNHPSTDFGRALEEIFEILGIQATVKHPATWAIKQINEEDFEKKSGGLLGALLELNRPPKSQIESDGPLGKLLAKPSEN